MLEIFKNGGPVMYPLLLCSFIVLTVIFDRIIFWINLTIKRDKSLLNEVMEICQRGDWDLVRQRVSGSKDHVVRILISGIVHRNFSMGKAMESAAGVEVKKMQRFMGVLDTMITVAPLLGILGTVLGIISSFEVIGEGGIDHPRAVTAGIAQALITTATGLSIAIFTVFPYNYFTAKIESAVHEIENYATSLEIVFEKLVKPSKEKGEKE